MPEQQSLLVLHGITMSGASMVRTLGPLGAELQGLGFSLVAPNAAHRLEAAELSPLMAWMGGRYRAVGQDVDADFKNGKFWDAGEHYDWFQSSTDAQSGKKTYQALLQSLEGVANAIQDEPVVGVIGFSQGAAMAMVLASLAARGDERFAKLRFGMFLSGFKPEFEVPEVMAYPIGPFRRLLVIGERDPIFPGNSAYLASVSQAFSGGEEELIVVPGLGHEVPTSPELVAQLARFVATSATH
jgi:predicted esterase